MQSRTPASPGPTREWHSISEVVHWVISIGCLWRELHSLRQVSRLWRAVADRIALQLYDRPCSEVFRMVRSGEDPGMAPDSLPTHQHVRRPLSQPLDRLCAWLRGLVRVPAVLLVYHSGVDWQKYTQQAADCVGGEGVSISLFGSKMASSRDREHDQGVLRQLAGAVAHFPRSVGALLVNIALEGFPSPGEAHYLTVIAIFDGKPPWLRSNGHSARHSICHPAVRGGMRIPMPFRETLTPHAVVGLEKSPERGPLRTILVHIEGPVADDDVVPTARAVGAVPNTADLGNYVNRYFGAGVLLTGGAFHGPVNILRGRWPDTCIGAPADLASAMEEYTWGGLAVWGHDVGLIYDAPLRHVMHQTRMECVGPFGRHCPPLCRLICKGDFHRDEAGGIPLFLFQRDPQVQALAAMLHDLHPTRDRLRMFADTGFGPISYHSYCGPQVSADDGFDRGRIMYITWDCAQPSPGPMPPSTAIRNDRLRTVLCPDRCNLRPHPPPHRPP